MCWSHSAWQTFNAGVVVPIVAGATLRTPPSSLCEVETASHDVLRLNEKTEVVLHKAEEIELVSGQLWCSTATSPRFMILVPGRSLELESTPSTKGLSQFRCPSNSITQWSVRDHETTCLDLSDATTELTMMELKSPDAKTLSPFSCVVQPGQSLAVVHEQRLVARGSKDRLLATGWQLPLRAVRHPHDPELQSCLQSLLAGNGRTKMSSMYDSQIGRPGPAGTTPLIAFVQTSKGSENPDLRYQAMQIIADLAPASTRSDLELLAIRLKGNTESTGRMRAQLVDVSGIPASPCADRPGFIFQHVASLQIELTSKSVGSAGLPSQFQRAGQSIHHARAISSSVHVATTPGRLRRIQ